MIDGVSCTITIKTTSSKKKCIYYGSAICIYKCIFLLNSDKWAFIRGTIKFSIFQGFYVKDFPAALTKFYHLALVSVFLIAANSALDIIKSVFP